MGWEYDGDEEAFWEFANAHVPNENYDNVEYELKEINGFRLNNPYIKTIIKREISQRFGDSFDIDIELRNISHYARWFKPNTVSENHQIIFECEEYLGSNEEFYMYEESSDPPFLLLEEESTNQYCCYVFDGYLVKLAIKDKNQNLIRIDSLHDENFILTALRNAVNYVTLRPQIECFFEVFENEYEDIFEEFTLFRRFSLAEKCLISLFDESDLSPPENKGDTFRQLILSDIDIIKRFWVMGFDGLCPVIAIELAQKAFFQGEQNHCFKLLKDSNDGFSIYVKFNDNSFLNFGPVKYDGTIRIGKRFEAALDIDKNERLVIQSSNDMANWIEK